MANGLTRREMVAASAAAAIGIGGEAMGASASAPADAGGLCLNEDDSHFFFTRAGKALTARDVEAWVDQYADTQVRELMLCPNCMRTSYGSRVWDPIWRGYDPAGPDDQPLLASTRPDDRKGARGWIHTAWQLDRDGLDPYALWIRRARARGISPWLSMRMNDVHNVDDERSFIHSEFWRAHPEYRRVPDRFREWTDRAFDYAHREVRDYHLALIAELLERYDPDGLELDWMRFGFHFRPGHETEGAGILTEFMATVRRMLDRAGRKRRRRILLGARVPSRPATSLALGMDAATWARRRLVDMLVVTPFWASAETDMPIETWKALLAGTGVRLAAGLELLIRPYPGYASPGTNSLETVRGAAASFLQRGTDRVYLFNHMDSQTAMADQHNYPTLLRECGSLRTLAGKPRRHVVTFADTWAPGEPQAALLPRAVSSGDLAAFRVATGPRPTGACVVRLGIAGADAAAAGRWEVRANGVPCAFLGPQTGPAPWPRFPVMGYAIETDAMHDGHTLIEVAPTSPGTIHWVEVAVSA